MSLDAQHSRYATAGNAIDKEDFPIHYATVDDAVAMNGVSIFLDPNWKDAEAIHLFTDASGTLGYGAYFNGAWFRGDWLPHPCGPFSGRSCLPSLQQPARGDISCNQLSLFSALAPQANPQPTLVPPQLAELRWRSSSAEHWPCPISTHTRPASGDLSMNLQSGSIQEYISAVSYLHHMNVHRSPASKNPMIKFLVQGVERSMPAAHLKPKRQPITNKMLGQRLSQRDRDHKPSAVIASAQ
ncbi:hypothetical protein EMCRGX_G006216 [Ephydatia muelleri]